MMKQKRAMKKKRLHRCCKCNNIATWFYIPSGNGRRFYCDEHVPRGCTCNVDNIQDFGEPTNDKNVIWWSKNSYENFLKQETDPTKIEEYTTKTRQSDSFYYEQVDEKGRRLPCCEFDYDENGYEIEDSPLLINKGDVLHIFEKAYTYLKNYYSRNEILKGDTDSFYNFFMAFINTW